MVKIYNKSDELELKNVDIDFKNSSMNLGREYSDDISITLKGACGYNTIKKIIELKEKVSNTYSVDMHFVDFFNNETLETLTYGRLTMSGFDFRFENRRGVLPEEIFHYEIRLAAKTRKDA